MNPHLSIIIVTWNTAKITAKCVDTIKKHIPSDLSYEIIIVDNGSTDDTIERLKKFSDIKLIQNGQNLGFSKANNIGVTQAKGEYLLFLNSDMELIDSSIGDMLQFLKKSKETGLIGPKFLNIDLTDQGSVFPPQTILNAFKEFWLGTPSYSKYIPDTEKPTGVWAISGGAVMVKKEIFLKIGGWNEKYFFYYEDLDLCRAVRNLGLKIVYFPKCQVIHRHGASGSNLADPKNQWRRLVPGSIKYHGRIKHTLINFAIWSGQKFRKVFSL